MNSLLGIVGYSLSSWCATAARSVVKRAFPGVHVQVSCRLIALPLRRLLSYSPQALDTFIQGCEDAAEQKLSEPETLEI